MEIFFDFWGIFYLNGVLRGNGTVKIFSFFCGGGGHFSVRYSISPIN